MSRSTIKLALDWTPNTIHTGLYVALLKGFYSREGLDVELLPPDEGYTTTAVRRLAKGEVDLAICPSESCIAYAESSAENKEDSAYEPVQLQAIYAILQRDASAIVSTKADFSDIRRLEHGVYGSYNARYEDHIVRAMVTAGGGDGQKMTINGEVGKLGLFEEMTRGGVDATWVFMPWEGIEAQMDGTKLNVFRPEDFNVPYGYSPVIARNNKAGKHGDDVYEKFVRATRQGYEIAMKDVAQAVRILSRYCEPPRSMEFLDASQEAINGFYSDGSVPGHMSEEKWVAWIEWLKRQGLLKVENMAAQDLFTNKFNVEARM